jgi:hypothetical protein
MTPAAILRIIARGVEVGHTGRMHTLRRNELMAKARDYCDEHGLTYAQSDLQFVERVAFLNAGDSR